MSITTSTPALRHAFVTAALDAGVPLRDVQEAAFHADPRTTGRPGFRSVRLAHSGQTDHCHHEHRP
jgi:site-specific recombinase XerD